MPPPKQYPIDKLVPFTEAQFAEIRQFAEAHKVSVSEAVRRLVAAGLVALTPKPRAKRK